MSRIITPPFVPGDRVGLADPDAFVHPADSYVVSVVHVSRNDVSFTIRPTERAYIGGPLVVAATDLRHVFVPGDAVRMSGDLDVCRVVSVPDAAHVTVSRGHDVFTVATSDVSRP